MQMIYSFTAVMTQDKTKKSKELTDCIDDIERWLSKNRLSMTEDGKAVTTYQFIE